MGLRKESVVKIELERPMYAYEGVLIRNMYVDTYIGVHTYTSTIYRFPLYLD